jgi:hypothetical protein
MNKRQLILSAAISLALSPAAFAASSSADRCSALEGQFDKAVMSTHAPKVANAKTLRTDGAKLCAQGKADEGVKKLEEAVKMLGQTPARN